MLEAETATMDSVAGSNLLEACGRCGCPLVGNEVFCSACGHRIVQDDRRRIRYVIGVAVLTALTGVGVWQARSCREPPSRPQTRAPTPLRIRG